MPMYCTYLIRIILFLFVSLIPATLTAQVHHGVLTESDAQVRLRTEAGRYMLQLSKNDTTQYLPLPTQWLIPQEEEEAGYVKALNYDEQVTAFTVGGSFTGFHLSSYEIQQEGSAQAAAGRDVFLVYEAKEHTLYPGQIDLGITKERVRSGGVFLATNSHFVLGDINRDGFNDIGVLKEELEFSPRSQSYILHPVDWNIFEHDRWIHRSDSSGIFPVHGVITLPLIGLSKSPVDYARERHLKRNVCVLNYEDFGVQAMAYDLIGYQWYQWNNHGDSDPAAHYDINVVVYKDILPEKVKEFYPVSKELKLDFRYVEYNRAVTYLNKQLLELVNLQQEDSTDVNSDMIGDLISALRKTREEIVVRFQD